MHVFQCSIVCDSISCDWIVSFKAIAFDSDGDIPVFFFHTAVPFSVKLG